MSARIGAPISIGGGGIGRTFTSGSSTSAPSSGTGANGDVHASTTHPYPVFQKQAGSWADVSWSEDSYFSMGSDIQNQAVKEFYLDSIHTPTDGDVLTLTTNNGTVTVHFHNGSPNESYTTSVLIGPGVAAAVANGLMGWSATLQVTYMGETLIVNSLDGGYDALVGWSNTGSLIFGEGTVNGSTSSGIAVNGPFTIKAAVPGSRHIIRSAAIGGGPIVDYWVFFGADNGDVAAFGPSGDSAGVPLTLTAIAVTGQENVAVIARQEGNLPEAGSQTLSVKGFTLQD
jgi:hypothetical protein